MPHELPDPEKSKLMKGDCGRELLKIVERSTAAFFWGNVQSRVMPSSGSAFFVKTSAALFGVTAKHVYEAFEERANHDRSMVCQLNDVAVDLRPRLISKGCDCDVATFEILPSELSRVDRLTIPWPPYIPPVNKSVLIAGFPGLGKRFSQSGILTFGLCHACTSISSVSDRDISMVREPDDEVADVVGKGLPPRGFDMGGMSGGPVIALLENVGIVSWALAGVIYECGTYFETLLSG